MTYVPRRISAHVQKLARGFPVVVLTGPRQSGKTTLARHLFPRAAYHNLEAPDTREWLADDPRDFLAGLDGPVVLDEIQRVPSFLSYLQEAVDADPRPGRFILTGSANLLLVESVSQSLAGRAAFATLLPFDLDEVRASGRGPETLWEALLHGGYPPLFDRDLAPRDWLDAYVAAYVERDVRRMVNVRDLVSFQTFLGLLAGRTASFLNLSGLASDCGISQPTAKAWLSVLEASHLVHRLPVHHARITRSLVKAPKIHFLDGGLLCHLLGIREVDQLRRHPLRGAIFESFVVAELLKARLARGLRGGLFTYRDRRGLEVDLVVETTKGLRLVECKSSSTPASDGARPLELLAGLVEGSPDAPPCEKILVHGGTTRSRRRGSLLLPWQGLHRVDWS